MRAYSRHIIEFVRVNGNSDPQYNAHIIQFVHMNRNMDPQYNAERRSCAGAVGAASAHRCTHTGPQPARAQQAKEGRIILAAFWEQRTLVGANWLLGFVNC